jgi:hypothetical protein
MAKAPIKNEAQANSFARQLRMLSGNQVVQAIEREGREP